LDQSWREKAEESLLETVDEYWEAAVGVYHQVSAGQKQKSELSPFLLGINFLWKDFQQEMF
jgi:hypothetical protein